MLYAQSRPEYPECSYENRQFSLGFISLTSLFYIVSFIFLKANLKKQSLLLFVFGSIVAVASGFKEGEVACLTRKNIIG